MWRLLFIVAICRSCIVKYLQRSKSFPQCGDCCLLLQSAGAVLWSTSSVWSSVLGVVIVVYLLQSAGAVLWSTSSVSSSVLGVEIVVYCCSLRELYCEVPPEKQVLSSVWRLLFIVAVCRSCIVKYLQSSKSVPQCGDCCLLLQSAGAVLWSTSRVASLELIVEIVVYLLQSAGAVLWSTSRVASSVPNAT